jgi:predicted cation transporter
LINYNSLRCQTFYDRGGRRAGIFMLDRSFFFHVSRKPFFFTHQVDQFIFDTYMRQTKFVKDLFAKFKQIFIKRCLVEVKLYKKEMRSLHTLIRTTRTFIYPLCRVLLGNKFLSLMRFSVTIKICFMF